MGDNARYINGVYCNSSGMSDGDLYRYDSGTGTFVKWTPDHTDLDNIGTKTHAQIDTHVADSTIHFTEASIDHTAISNIGTTSHANIDTHIGDGTKHFLESAIDGDHLDIDFTPSNYTPDTSPAEADDVDDLAAHLKGIDTEIGLFAGGGEANTGSNLGGATGVYEQKVAGDLQFNSIHATQTSETSNVISIIIPLPGLSEYEPIEMEWEDADNINVPAGEYYMYGERYDGRYRRKNMIPVTVAADISVDIDGASLMGGDIDDSWYSVWLYDATTVKIIPLIRADTISYDGSTYTQISCAEHDDGSTDQNGFLDQADEFNDYQLIQLTWGTYHGETYTVADTTTGSPAYLKIAGNVTSEFSAAQWLLLAPPTSQDCVFLGTFRQDSSGEVTYFEKVGHHYDFGAQHDVNGNLDTSFANTDLSSVIPPTALSFSAGIYATASGTPTWLMCTLAKTSSSSDQWKQYWDKSYGFVMEDDNIKVTVPCYIRNKFVKDDGGQSGADTGTFRVNGYDE